MQTRIRKRLHVCHVHQLRPAGRSRVVSPVSRLPRVSYALEWNTAQIGFESLHLGVPEVSPTASHHIVRMSSSVVLEDCEKAWRLKNGSDIVASYERASDVKT